MGIFGTKSEGGILDVIRCDEAEYLVWKWRPSGPAGSTRKENAIRRNSALRVKDGEVAVFVCKQPNGPLQDYIEGPFDASLQTANLPILANIMALAFAGSSPFQAEIYFINLAGNIRLPFSVPYFGVADPRFSDKTVQISVRGSVIFSIREYKGFIKKHRLINFELAQFSILVRDAVYKHVKSVVANAPIDNGISVLQIERKIEEISDLIEPRIAKAFEENFGVQLESLNLSEIEIDKTTDDYAKFLAVTADLQAEVLIAQKDATVANLLEMQQINATHNSESLRIGRKFQELGAETMHLAAHQINLNANVLETAASNLGQMGSLNLGSGGGIGGGFNPIGVMTGLAVGGSMGAQMAGMMNTAGQAMQQPLGAPPPLPSYHVSFDGQSSGPFARAQLQDMVLAGQISHSTFVWKAGMAEWLQAGKVAELDSLFRQTPPPPPGSSPPPPPGA